MKGSKAFSMLFLVWSSAIFVAVMLLVLPFILIISAFDKSKRASNIIFVFLKIWAWIFSTLCFFQIKSLNRTAIDSGKSFIYVCNHNSYLDAVAVVLAIPGSFRPLGKIEMAKIPLFGLIYRNVVVMIDRASKESRAKSVEHLKADLAAGRSILIFPEGTMNRTEKALSDFYDGAFRLAIETKTPIAPMVVINARNLLPRARPLAARPGIITCVFDQPINVSDLTPDDMEGLKTQVYNSMELLIKKHS